MPVGNVGLGWPGLDQPEAPASVSGSEWVCRPARGVRALSPSGASHCAAAPATLPVCVAQVRLAIRLEGPTYFSANAYKCPAVRMYKVLSAIAGVAEQRSPSSGFCETTTAFSAPAFRTVTIPLSSEVK